MIYGQFPRLLGDSKSAVRVLRKGRLRKARLGKAGRICFEESKSFLRSNSEKSCLTS